MPQIIEQGDVFGRIGKNIGEGFGEGAQKQIERNRLSKGAEQIAGDKTLSPLQKQTRLLGLPGGAEASASLSDFFRSAAFAKEPEEEVVTKEKISPKNGMKFKEQEKISPISSKSLLSSPEEVSLANSKVLQQPTSQQRDELARKLINSGQVIDPLEAQQQALNQLNLDREAQKNQLKEMDDNISQRMALDLQGGGLADYKDVGGEIQRKLKDEAKTRLLVKGESPAEIENQISSILTDLGKVATKTKTTGSLGNLATSSVEKVRQLKEQKKEFEKYGFGEIFNDLAEATMGITPMQAALELDGLNNKDFKKLVEENKGSKVGVDLLGNNPPLSEKLVNRLVESITPEDNLLSMAAFLRNNHLDVSEFLKKAGEKKNLEPEQKKQLQKKGSNSFLGDILFRIF